MTQSVFDTTGSLVLPVTDLAFPLSNIIGLKHSKSDCFHLCVCIMAIRNYRISHSMFYLSVSLRQPIYCFLAFLRLQIILRVELLGFNYFIQNFASMGQKEGVLAMNHFQIFQIDYYILLIPKMYICKTDRKHNEFKFDFFINT